MAPDLQTLNLNAAILFLDLAPTVFPDEMIDDVEYAGSRSPCRPHQEN